MVQLVRTKAFLQLAKAAAMCTAPHAETSPIPPFLLAQNLSSKQTAPTDNMWPKSDDAIWHHHLLKVKYIDMHGSYIDSLRTLPSLLPSLPFTGLVSSYQIFHMHLADFLTSSQIASLQIFWRKSNYTTGS